MNHHVCFDSELRPQCCACIYCLFIGIQPSLTEDFLFHPAAVWWGRRSKSKCCSAVIKAVHQKRNLFIFSLFVFNPAPVWWFFFAWMWTRWWQEGALGSKKKKRRRIQIEPDASWTRGTSYINTAPFQTNPRTPSLNTDDGFLPRQQKLQLTGGFVWGGTLSKLI